MISHPKKKSRGVTHSTATVGQMQRSNKPLSQTALLPLFLCQSVRNHNTFTISSKTLFKFQPPRSLVWNVSMFNTALMMPPLQTSPDVTMEITPSLVESLCYNIDQTVQTCRIKYRAVHRKVLVSTADVSDVQEL